jgi:type IV pilus assembly protein PilM
MLRDQRILALDIGASTIKLAEFDFHKAGGVELRNFGVGSLDLDQQADAERIPHVVATIRDLLHERQIKPGPVLISVSGQSVFSRFVKLPPVDKEKVYQIILYEAQQNVPFPIDEVVWDYQLIGRGEGELDVMLAAIKADIIVGLTDAVEQAGLTTDLVDVAPMALYNAVRYNYSDLNGCTLVIDIGARSTDLIFMEEGRVFIRSVPVAGNAVTQQIMREFELSFHDAEEMKKSHSFVSFGGAYEAPKSEVADKVSKIVRGVMTRMHAEINRSINFYRSQQNGLQPSLVLLTGGCSVIPYSDVFLKEKLKVDVDYLNPFINVPVGENISAEEIGKNAHMLGQVVGLALRKVLTCPIEVNLLPPKVLAQKEFGKKQPVLLLAAAALILTLLVWAGYFFKMDRLTRKQLDRVQAQVADLERVERPLMATLGETSRIKERIERLLALPERRTLWLQMLAQVQAALPQELWLSSVRPIRHAEGDAQNPPAEGAPPPGSVVRLELSGYGYIDRVGDGRPIIVFRDNLRKSPLFDSGGGTEILLQPSPAPEAAAREFKIQVTLRKPVVL